MLGFRDQTLPARRCALADSGEAFATIDGEGHDAQLAVLEVIGDSLQIVEDVGVMADAFLHGYGTLAFYVRATVYDPAHVNNFFSAIHKRDAEYILRLAALHMNGEPVHRHFEFKPPLDSEDELAIASAEAATAKLLQDHLCALARAWETYRRFFHAYKHGGLLANPETAQLVEDRMRVVARMAVWRRQCSDPQIGGYFSRPLAEIVEHVIDIGELALDVGRYLSDTRFRVLDLIRANDAGAVEIAPMTDVPWEFWMRRSDVGETQLERLSARFGLQFDIP